MPCNHSYAEADGHLYCTVCGARFYGSDDGQYVWHERHKPRRSKKGAGILLALLLLALPAYVFLAYPVETAGDLVYGTLDVISRAFAAASAYTAAIGTGQNGATGPDLSDAGGQGPDLSQDSGYKSADLDEGRVDLEPIRAVASDLAAVGAPVEPAAKKPVVEQFSFFDRSKHEHTVPTDYTGGFYAFTYVIGKTESITNAEAAAVSDAAERAWEESGSAVEFQRIGLGRSMTPNEADVSFVVNFISRNDGLDESLHDSQGYFSCTFIDQYPYNEYAESCEILVFVENLACNGRWMRMDDSNLVDTLVHEMGHFLLTPSMGHNPSADHLMYGERDGDDVFMYSDRGLKIPDSISQYLKYEDLEYMDAENARLDGAIGALDSKIGRLGGQIDSLRALYFKQAGSYEDYAESRILYEGSAEAARADSLYQAAEETRLEMNALIGESNSLINESNALVDEKNNLAEIANDAYDC